MSGEGGARFAGRVAIITGAASAIGEATATALARGGADLVIAGRHGDTLEPIAAAARGLGVRAVVSRCDVTASSEVAAMVAAAREAFAGRIDMLVNMAGGTGGLAAPVWEIAPHDFQRVVALNLTGSFLTIAAVLPTMIAQKWGRIVNIGGTYGLRGRAGRAAYSAAKWGLRGLTKSVALEAAPYDVTVNCVCPGMVEGPAFEAAQAALAARENLAATAARGRLLQETPTGRVSTPDDIAAAVVFLASDGARQITGQDLAVDGGWAG